MPNSLQRSAIGSPASRRATNCSLSSMTEHSFQGIHFLLKKEGSVTHVSGTFCHLCVGSLTVSYWVLCQKPQPTIQPTPHCTIELLTPSAVRYSPCAASVSSRSSCVYRSSVV